MPRYLASARSAPCNASTNTNLNLPGLQRVNAVLGTQVNARVFEVRDVAPQKLMLCAMFQLPEAVCYQPDDASSSSAPALEKRPSSEGGDDDNLPSAKRHKSSDIDRDDGSSSTSTSANTS